MKKSLPLMGLLALILAASCGNKGDDRRSHGNGDGDGDGDGDEMSPSGGRDAGTGGDTPGTGGDETGAGGALSGGAFSMGGMGGEVMLGGAPSETGGTGGDPPVAPGSLLFDLPVREPELLTGHQLVPDLNNDGRPDSIYRDPFAVVGHTLVNIAVDQGDGTFTATQTIQISGSTLSYTIADANGDNIPDLLMNDGFHLGAGDGTFSAPVAYPGGIPVDLNGDGRADGLEIRGSNTPNSLVHLALEGGGYQDIILYVFGASHDTNIGDFDGDGSKDFALNSTVYRGLGDGTFSAALPSDCTNCPLNFDTSVVGDINNDGRDDLLLAYLNRIEVFLGQEDGSLSVAGQINVRATENMTLGYLDGDEHLDLVLTNGSYVFETFYGDGQGAFGDRKTYHLHGSALDAPLIDDRDGDGTADIVIGGVWRVLGRGERRFRAAVESPSPGGSAAPQLGILAEGGPAEAVGFSYNAEFYRAPFLPDLTLGPAETCTGPGTGIYRRVADMTGDGIDDLTLFSGDLNVWVGQGGCDFAPAVPHAFSGYSIWFHPLNDDALVDVVFRAPAGLGITLATGSGTFAAPVVSPFTGFESDIAIADLNDDGHVDVVVVDHNNHQITVHLSDANYQLTQGQIIAIPSNETPYLTASDIDHDGDIDIVMVSGIRLEILRNDGAGALTQEVLQGATAMRGFRVGDVDQDGLLELIAHTNQSVSHAYRVPKSGPVELLAEIVMPSESNLFDVDQDGDLDLVKSSSGSVAVGRNLLFD